MQPFFSGIRASQSFSSITTPQVSAQRFQLASQPFKIELKYSSVRFIDDCHRLNNAIGDDIALALQDSDHPEITLRVLEMVFDTSSEAGLNEFIRTRNIEVHAINDRVILGLAKKGIGLTLEGEGTIKTIKMTEDNLRGIMVRNTLLPKRLVDIITAYFGTPGDFINGMLNTYSNLPKELVDIIMAYGPYETRITYDKVLKEVLPQTPGESWQPVPEQWERIFVLASSQKKIHVLNFSAREAYSYILSHFRSSLVRLVLQKLDLSRLDLSGLKLTCVEFIDTDLRDTNLGGTEFFACVLKNCLFSSNTNLTDIEVSNSDIVDSSISSGTVLGRGKFNDAIFKNSPVGKNTLMDGASFDRVILINSKIEQPRETTSPPSFTSMKADKDSLPLPVFAGSSV